MDANPSAILAELLRARGLSVTERGDGSVAATNPLHPLVGEAVGTINGSYLTNYGYELGEQGDERATADRVAFLLGVPRGSAALSLKGGPGPVREHRGIRGLDQESRS
ncbi:hypothetical protein [Nonomuraea guangzhouensis]|uniref:Uncharacterized protein n=1 Tax=Nonomuraea guangzhouensis TaxID=1291555 RepID=A0ABW4GDS6_9ACTN|nr:hypothetical protein [Nonomuraea guangzhouensis]